MKKNKTITFLAYTSSAKTGFVMRAKPLKLISIIPLCALLESRVHFSFISMCHKTAYLFFPPFLFFFFCSWGILKSFFVYSSLGMLNGNPAHNTHTHTHTHFKEFSVEPGYLSDSQQEANWITVICWQQLNLQTEAAHLNAQSASLY